MTTALEATQIMADVENKLAIAHGATEVVETRTENQTAEEKEKADKETEKVKKEKEKLFGIYNKIKLSNEKYFHDTEEGNIYLMGENGDLFRYKFSWDVLDSTYNLWHNIQMMWNSAKLITSYNLPKPTTWNFQG